MEVTRAGEQQARAAAAPQGARGAAAAATAARSGAGQRTLQVRGWRPKPQWGKLPCWHAARCESANPCLSP